jgi:GNAT superfamily N-acetyltransferase
MHLRRSSLYCGGLLTLAAVTLTIRRARDDERNAVARIHRASAVAAYNGIFPPGRAFPWAQALERWRNFAGEIFVAETYDVDELMGFVAFDSHELHALYVLPDYWNRGIGRRLLEAAVGVSELWVLHDNFRARRFYEGHAWRADGMQRQAYGVIELRYQARSTNQT